MSYDRFIRWRGSAPSQEDLGNALVGFLGGFATEVKYHDDRWIAVLGPASATFSGQVLMQDERFIEVWTLDNTTDVITRMADHATNALADEFSVRIALYWNGKLHE